MKKIIFLLLLTTYFNSFSQLPTESFEGTTFPPIDWAVFDNGVSGTPNANWSTNSVSYSGLKAAFKTRQPIMVAGSISDDFLATPMLNIPVNGQISFFTRLVIAAIQTGSKYKIKIKDAAIGPQNDPNGYETIQQWDDSNLVTVFNQYEQKKVNIPASFSGINVYIAFCSEYTSTGAVGGNLWLVDDVNVGQACPSFNVNQVGVSTITQTSAVYNWASLAGVTSYQTEITLASNSFTGIPTSTTSSNIFNQVGLSSNICYKYRVRADCGNGNFGDWSNGVNFCTQITNCPMPSNLIATNITANSALINWTEMGTSTQWKYFITPCGSPAPTSTSNWVTTTANPSVLNNLTPLTCYNVFLIAVCSPTETSSMTNPITFTTQGLLPICGGNFIDNGGINNNYNNNSNEITTICPQIAGEAVVVTFTSFDTEANFDVLYVYDGNSTNSPQIISINAAPGFDPNGIAGAFWGNTIPGPFVSTSPDGCLTFRFRSDASVNRTGWIANVNCVNQLTYNTGFRLSAFIDINNNGVKDIGENNFPMGQFTHEKNNSGVITNTISPNSSFIIRENNTTNSYNFGYIINANYTADYFILNPTFSNISIPNSTAGFIDYQFAIVPAVVYKDLTVDLISIFGNPRAGAFYSNKIIYKNLGNQTITSGTISFTKDIVNTITSTSEPVNLTTTGFNFNFTNLAPFEIRALDIMMYVPPIPTVSINQLLTNFASISTPETESILTNNSASNTQSVVAAYDPNDITESHGEKILFSGFAQNEYLNYTIRFENTGNIEALDVKITDVLDPRINESSIEMIAASHNYILTRVGNNLEWKFRNILLAPSVANTEIGKGFVTFKAKLKLGFSVGTIVPNMAKIYFDTNPAIETNTFNTEFVSVLSNVNFTQNNFEIFPNPANKFIQINLQNTSENIQTITVNDVLGKIVKKLDNIASKQNMVDVSDLQKGLYLLEITTENNLKQTKKLIIE